VSSSPPYEGAEPLLAALMADMMASQTGETLSLLKFRLNLIPRRIFPGVHAASGGQRL
jgi:hypothetical protein